MSPGNNFSFVLNNVYYISNKTEKLEIQLVLPSNIELEKIKTAHAKLSEMLDSQIGDVDGKIKSETEKIKEMMGLIEKAKKEPKEKKADKKMLLKLTRKKNQKNQKKLLKKLKIKNNQK